MGNYIVLVVSCILINNIVLAQFLGNCPFLGTSKKMETAVGMAMAVPGAYSERKPSIKVAGLCPYGLVTRTLPDSVNAEPTRAAQWMPSPGVSRT